MLTYENNSGRYLSGEKKTVISSQNQVSVNVSATALYIKSVLSRILLSASMDKFFLLQSKATNPSHVTMLGKNTVTIVSIMATICAP